VKGRKKGTLGAKSFPFRAKKLGKGRATKPPKTRWGRKKREQEICLVKRSKVHGRKGSYQQIEGAREGPRKRSFKKKK